MSNKWIWLSHQMTENTPAYGGGNAFSINADKQMLCGDSCNTVNIEMSNHIGSHVDAPNHFVQQGKTIPDYSPAEWVFNAPVLLDVNVDHDNLVSAYEVEKQIEKSAVNDADFVLLRTGAESYRTESGYWEKSPAFSSDIFDVLNDKFKSFSAIGLDTISISSITNRELGREAHRVFLNNGVRIFEDLTLANITSTSNLYRIIALPFRYESSDGAPVTIIAEVDNFAN